MAASVILAKCGVNSGTFGIRVEKRENSWVRTWAFSIDEAKAKREGFDETKIEGSFRSIDGYPGCPYCGDDELVQCGCGKMICYKEGRIYSFQCPWCGVKIKEISEVESFTAKSGGY